MSSAAAQQLVMPVAQYLALPDELRAEYVDGAAIVNPPPTFAHQKICQRLTALLESAVAGELEVVAAAGWQLADDHVRIPDVMVLRDAPQGPLVTDAPLVVVEVLSTNRADDLVRKSAEYLEAGVAQYWVVDPRDRVIDVHRNVAGRWQPGVQLTDDDPVRDIDIAAAVTVRLSLAAVLGPL